MSDRPELVVYHDRDAWLGARAACSGYGASGIAEILVQSPYGSRYDAWAKRTGRAPAFVGNSATEAGNELEWSVLTWYARRSGYGDRVWPFTVRPAIITHPTDPLAYCSPDAIVMPQMDDEVADGWPTLSYGGAPIQIIGGCDAKTHGSWIDDAKPGERGYGDDGTDIVPMHTWWQCQWSCYVTGAPWWDVAVLTGGRTLLLRTFRVTADAECIALAAEEVRRFHEEHVVLDRAPAVTSRELASIESAVRAVHPRSTERVKDCDETDAFLLRRLALVEDLQQRLEVVQSSLRNAITLRMGDAQAIVVPGAGKRGAPLEVVTYRGGGEAAPRTDWEATARALADRMLTLDDPTYDRMNADEVLAEHLVTKPGGTKSRTFLPKARKDKLLPILDAMSSAGLLPDNAHPEITAPVERALADASLDVESIPSIGGTEQ